MTTVVLAGGPVGGVVQGNFGTYQQGSDGNYTVDSRDAQSLLALGMNYVKATVRNYTPPAAPLVATSGKIVASVALSNGGLTIANQPDVMRPANIVIGTGTAPVTAGSLSMVYTANDGSSTTDTLSLVLAASAGNTLTTSKGMQKLATAIVSGLAGGTSPFIHIDTTGAISVPVDIGAVDFALYSEIVDGAAETIGTLAVALGSVAPTTAPNGTHLYSFGYNFTAPVS